MSQSEFITNGFERRAPSRTPKAHDVPIVLAAIDRDAAGVLALDRARGLAAALAARLLVLHVVPGPVLFGHSPSPFARLDRARKLRAWCEEAIGAELRDADVMVAAGAFGPVVERAARVKGAAVVVVPAGKVVKGFVNASSRADRFVKRIGRPVLFSGPRKGSAAVVAATDLTSPILPVVSLAARLAGGLGGRVTAVHDSGGRGLHAGAGARTDARAGLASFPPQVDGGAPIDLVVTLQRGAPHAILEVAESKDADLIVTGRTLSSKARPVARGRTLRTLLTATDRSVLAVPIAALSTRAA